MKSRVYTFSVLQMEKHVCTRQEKKLASLIWAATDGQEQVL